MKLLPTLVLVSICNYAVVVGAVAISSIFQPTPAGQLLQLVAPSALPVTAPAASIMPQTESNTAAPANQPAAAPADVPAAEPTAAPAEPTAAPGCLVQIKGVSYDLQAFRTIHEGGDIFQCNTDMTAIFSGEHPDSYLQQLEQYRL